LPVELCTGALRHRARVAEEAGRQDRFEVPDFPAGQLAVRRYVEPEGEGRRVGVRAGLRIERPSAFVNHTSHPPNPNPGWRS